MPSWASTTNYKSLYNEEYFGKSSGAVSFIPNNIIKLITNFSSSKNISNLLDIGSGSGELSKLLSGYGLNCINIDYDPVTPHSFHFDLSDSSENINLINNIKHKFSGEYLCTCLDVLEHIDIEDLPHAFSNLSRLTDRYIIVSISTRPSSRGNAYHSTVLPMETWIELFNKCGFINIDFKEDIPKRLFPIETLDVHSKIPSYWAKVDIFNDYREGDNKYLILEKKVDVNDQLVKESLITILDLKYKIIKRDQVKNISNYRIGMNIHHFQDFLNATPLFDIIDRNNLQVFIREAGSDLKEDELDIIRGFLKRNGIKIVLYNLVDDIDFNELAINVLFSFGESNVSISHILSSALVYKCNILGIRTILYQHGIWAENFDKK